MVSGLCCTTLTQRDNLILSLQIFLSQGVGLGIAQGLLYLPSLAIVGHHFKKRRTLVMGIVATGGSIGGIIHPIMLNQLFEGKIGFHNGVRISAAFNGALLLIANFISLIPGTGTQKKERSATGEVVEQPRFWTFFKEPAYCTAVIGYAFPSLGFVEENNLIFSTSTEISCSLLVDISLCFICNFQLSTTVLTPILHSIP
jgi:MFS family permease